MLGSLFGMTVTREIPAAVLHGLVRGQYTLHGGVIRWAAGTAQGGQIVCHLLPAANLLAPVAMTGAGILAGAIPVVGAIGSVVAAGGSILSAINTFRILKDTKAILKLSELNLAVTQSGFASIEQRLDSLDQKLSEIKSSVDAIQRLMQIEQRSELRAALDELRGISDVRDPEVRTKALVVAAGQLAKAGLIFEERAAAAATLPEAMACEEYFCIAVLARARCYAELREPTRALGIVRDLEKRWLALARGISKKFLIGSTPGRLFYSDFAKLASVPEIIGWLDFTEGTEKGIAWIDELRTAMEPWYYTRTPEPYVAWRRIRSQADIDEHMQLHETIILPALRKLTARAEVLSNYIGQFELMEAHRLTAQEFEDALSGVDKADTVDDFIILRSPALAA